MPQNLSSQALDLKERPASPIETLRREVVAAELRQLELEDRLLEVHTDRADAVTLLGQAELMLEAKIKYIVTLDQALNTRIRELETECDRKTTEIDHRGAVIAEMESRANQENAARDAIIKDLSHRLETANQELNKVHALARKLDEERAAAQTKLQMVTDTLTASRQELALAQSATETLQHRLAAESAERLTQETALKATREKLNQTEARLNAGQAQIAQIKTSRWWRLGRPWRALFGPRA